MRLVFFILTFTAFFGVYAGPLDSIKVYVRSEKDLPLPNQKLSIDKNPAKVTNKKGVFSFVPSKKLEIPCDVDIYSEEYAVDDYEYQETEKAFYITLRKLVVPEVLVQILFEDKSPAKKYGIKFKGKSYVTNEMGKVSIPGKLPNNKDFVLNDVVVSLSPKGKEYILILKQPTKLVTSNTVIEPPVPTQADTIPTATPVEKTTFQAYTEEFGKIEDELAFERKQIDDVDLKLRRQLEAITKRLNNEKGLSIAERNELLKYEAKLHKDLEENIVKFNESKKKIFFMMDKFRYSLMQKDSVNKIMEAKLKAETNRRKAIEMQSKRQALIYIIIIVTILILAIVFYGIARKIRLQKSLLSKSNERMIQTMHEKENRILSLRSIVIDLFVWAKQIGTSQPNLQLSSFVENENYSLASLLPEHLKVENINELKANMFTDKSLYANFWEALRESLEIDSWESANGVVDNNELKTALRISSNGFKPSYQAISSSAWQKASLISQLLNVDLSYINNELVVKFKNG